MHLTSRPGRLDWRSERDQIDLARVATSLLGEPPGRRGSRGLWWPCPFHGDRNPSFHVDPSRRTWQCFGCGAKGDAAELVMRLRGVTFPEAIRILTGGDLGPTIHRSTPPPQPVQSVGPSGLSTSEAMSLVADSSDRLWTPEGSAPLAYLMGERHLTEATIRQARLGWTPEVRLPRSAGGHWTARGWTIPWFDGDRLQMVNLRRPDPTGPKYVHAFRSGPTVYQGTSGATRPGLPLVVVEGEFDALLLGQELADLAVVVSVGSASIRPDLATLDRFGRYRPWHIATDADEAGNRAAEAWPKSARRVQPPTPFKDWTEARQGGIHLRRWWGDRLAGIVAPDLFSWSELADQRWGPAVGDPEAGIVIDRPDSERRRLAYTTIDPTHNLSVPLNREERTSWRAW